MRHDTTFAAALAAGLTLLGCSSGSPHDRNGAVQNRVALEAFGSCSALEQYVEDTAVSQMRADLTAVKQNAVNGGWFRSGGIAVAGDSAGPPMAAPGAGAPESGDNSSGAPKDYTTTNTQVEGVDEADFVKNDGTRIFVLSGNKLHVTRSWPASELALTSSVQVEGWPQELFLAGNRVVVFSSIYTPEWDLSGDKTVNGGVAVDAAYWGYWYANTTKVTTVDVSNVSAPTVVGEVYLPGGYVSSRRIDSKVRLVLRDDFRYPRDVQFWPTWPSSGTWSEGEFAAAVDTLMAKNESLIRGASLAQWLPSGKRRVGGELVDVGYRCEDFHAANAPTRLGLASVVTLDMADASAEVRRTTVVGEAGQVYASASSLYLASSHWWWWPEPGQTDATYLHKFDITEPDSARYVASGTVEGHIKDQFSLDEHEGFLRVATTINRRVRDEANPQNTWGTLKRTNRVTVFHEERGSLEAIGKTGELAEGETIFAVRFIGPRGFLVTFRQVDPLFAIDMSDPANPTVKPELKIPGFSTYLHPVDANHLLAVGEDRDADGGWTSRALKVSLYDVTDLANPKEEFKYLLGSSGSYSEANWNHKAFNYFASKKLLAIPFTDWSYACNASVCDYRSISNLQVLGVDVNAGFTFKGQLSLGDMYSQQYRSWTYSWQPYVRRSVMASDESGATFVYAIADAGIRVANVESLYTPVKTVNFPAPQY